jgi:hypothetical protein
VADALGRFDYNAATDAFKHGTLLNTSAGERR